MKVREEKNAPRVELERIDKKLKEYGEKIENAKDLQTATLLYQECNLIRAKRNALKDRIEKRKGRDVLMPKISIVDQL